MIISFLNQKGGAGKSTIARAMAAEFQKNQWHVKVADLDKGQQTAFSWSVRRDNNGITPAIETVVCSDPKTALELEKSSDVLFVDGKAFADNHLWQVAQAADLLIMPTGISEDDLKPTLDLATELTTKGIDRARIILVVSKVPEGGEKEAEKTINTIKAWNFNVVSDFIPMKTALSQAMDKGLAITETPFKTLRTKTDAIVQQLVDLAIEQTKTPELEEEGA